MTEPRNISPFFPYGFSLPQITIRNSTYRFLLGIVFTCAAHCSAADVSTIEQLFNQGNYEECTRAARVEVERGVWNERWPRLLMRSLLATGEYTEALARYEHALKRYPKSIHLRVLGATALRFNNHILRAKQEENAILEIVRQTPWRYSKAEDQIALGRHFLAQGEDAKQVLELFFDRARKAQPEFIESYIATAELALDKHDYQLAAEMCSAAEKLQPNNAQVAYLMARAWSASEPEKSLESLQQALNSNPRHIPTLLWQVDHFIDAERYSAAKDLLTSILEINLYEPKAWAYLSVIAHLSGQYQAQSMLRKAALCRWPMNPEVDYLIGTKLSQKYRFEESVIHQRRALVLDDSFRPAKFQLAQDLLRLGEEAEGWAQAQEVHSNDAYNVVAHNLVTLHDQISKFTTIEQDGFIVRMDSREARIYGNRVLALLLEARSALCSKYDVIPREPIVIEIFPQQKDFAIRTFGLPGGAGFLGVCFGRVITMNSPASQGETPANWQSVLWHEFCHVVTLEKTRNKMPRWLSEGISVYEERQKDLRWGQSMTPQYREMIFSDALTPVSELSSAFLNPPTPLHLQFAYFQSSLVVEYLIGQHGLDALKRVLEDLALGIPINEALERSVGSMTALNNEFFRYAREKAAALAADVDWSREHLPTRPSLDEWRTWLGDHPNNFWGLRAYSLALIEAQDWKTAQTVLEQRIRLFPADRGPGNPLELLAQVYRERDNLEQEHVTLRQLAELKADSVSLYRRLAELALAGEKWADVSTHAESLLAINPLLSTGHELLAQSAEHLGRYRDVAVSLQALVEMDPADPAKLHFRTATAYHHLGNHPDAKREVLRALEEAPRYQEAQHLLLQLVTEETEVSTQSTGAGKP
ncbi:MAG: hypothetical protein MK165_07450 [Pirellulaceae bacterium]|nr:hypothetical protein [Pirellulaceae bacterium]